MPCLHYKTWYLLMSTWTILRHCPLKMTSHTGTLMGVCHSASGALSQGDQCINIQSVIQNNIFLSNLKFNIDIQQNSLSIQTTQNISSQNYILCWSHQCFIGGCKLLFPKGRRQVERLQHNTYEIAITLEPTQWLITDQSQASKHVTLKQFSQVNVF